MSRVRSWWLPPYGEWYGNHHDAVEAFLVTQRPVRQAAAVRTAQALTSSAAPVPVTLMYSGMRRCAQTRQQPREVEQPRRHVPWVACYEATHALYARGTGIATIARQLGISRPTVYAYLRRATPPAPRSPQRSGQVLRPYLPYLIRRWREGITDSMRLWARDSGTGLYPLGPDRLPLHHAPATGCRSRPGP